MIPRRAISGLHRSGAILSIELIFVLPIISLILMAIVEFSLLLCARHQVEAASFAACRVATLPVSNRDELERALHRACKRALAKPRLVATYQLSYVSGPNSGDPVVVKVRVPMTAAAPNLLSIIGFSLKDRWLIADAVMRKE